MYLYACIFTDNETVRQISAWVSPYGRSIHLEIDNVEIVSAAVDLQEQRWYHLCQSWSNQDGQFALWLDAHVVAHGYAKQVCVLLTHCMRFFFSLSLGRMTFFFLFLFNRARYACNTCRHAIAHDEVKSISVIRGFFSFLLLLIVVFRKRASFKSGKGILFFLDFGIPRDVWAYILLNFTFFSPIYCKSTCTHTLLEKLLVLRVLHFPFV